MCCAVCVFKFEVNEEKEEVKLENIVDRPLVVYYIDMVVVCILVTLYDCRDGRD